MSPCSATTIQSSSRTWCAPSPIASGATPASSAFSVEAVNDESIHNHGAFARLSGHPAPTRTDDAVVAARQTTQPAEASAGRRHLHAPQDPTGSQLHCGSAASPACAPGLVCETWTTRLARHVGVADSGAGPLRRGALGRRPPPGPAEHRRRPRWSFGCARRATGSSRPPPRSCRTPRPSPPGTRTVCPTGRRGGRLVGRAFRVGGAGTGRRVAQPTLSAADPESAGAAGPVSAAYLDGMSRRHLSRLSQRLARHQAAQHHLGRHQGRRRTRGLLCCPATPVCRPRSEVPARLSTSGLPSTSSRPGSLTTTRWSNALAKLLADQPAVARYDRRPATDAEVRAFIRAGVRRRPRSYAHQLLREFRDANRACEQARFADLFRAERGVHR